MKLLESIAKKDLVYWIIILAVLLIVIATKFWGESEKIIDKFGFAATITSLILSVLAIIYSYVQSHDTSTMMQSVNDSINSLSNATEKIDNSTEKLEIIEKIAVTLGNMKEEICSTTENQVSSLENTMRSLLNDKSLDPEVISLSSTADKQLLADSFIPSLHIQGKLFLYYLLKCYEANKNFYNYRFSSMLSEIEFKKTNLNKDNIIMVYFGAFATITRVVASYGLIIVQGDEKSMVNDFTSELKTVLLSEISTRSELELIDDFVRRQEK
jgi:hypothetical protein